MTAAVYRTEMTDRHTAWRQVISAAPPPEAAS
jgi:hypothetical protein